MAQSELGPYRIERMLGRGGMGKVYAAVDETTGQQVAVKVLTAALSDDAHFRLRFEGEIEALKMLKHPHIVQLLAYGEQNGELFYAMELVDGRSLQEELRDGKRFDCRETMQIGIEICAALRHAHDRGVVHRDLKPANLMLSTDGTVKLTDFGIAKLFGASKMTVDGGVMGSADYMSPEQAVGESATTRSDLYSLGSVLYALLSGRPPFMKKTLPEVIHALRYEDPTPIGQLADVPLALESILLRLMQKDPQNRIATAQAAANRLAEIQHDTQSSAAGENIENAASPPDDAIPISLNTTVMAPAPIDPANGGHSIEENEHNPSALLVENSSDHSLGDSPTDSFETPPSATRFTTVSDQQHSSHRADPHETVFAGRGWWKTAVLVVALVLLIAIVVYALKPPSADTLHERIVEAAKSGQTEQLALREDDIRHFLKRFPDDPRRKQVAAYLEEIELYQIQERVQLRLQLRDRSDSLEPAERAYMEAFQRTATDPEIAAARMQAIIDVYGSQKDASQSTRRIVELARKQLQSLRTKIARETKQQQAEIQRRLQAAEKLVSSDRTAAAAICRGIIVLYADKPWAADLVKQAKELLTKLEALPVTEAKSEDEKK